MPAPVRLSSRSEVRRRRFLGLLGLQAPQPSAGRGTPPEEPHPRIVNFSVMRRPPPRTRDLSEQAKEVLRGLTGDLILRHAARLGEHLGDLDHMSRLVALSAKSAGGEIGSVCLYQDAVRRQAVRDRAQIRPTS